MMTPLHEELKRVSEDAEEQERLLKDAQEKAERAEEKYRRSEVYAKQLDEHIDKLEMDPDEIRGNMARLYFREKSKNTMVYDEELEEYISISPAEKAAMDVE